MTGGRPLRFLAMTLGGWTMIRIAFLLSDEMALPDGAVVPAVVGLLVPNAVSAVFARAPRRAPSPVEATGALPTKPTIGPRQFLPGFAQTIPGRSVDLARPARPQSLAVPTLRTVPSPSPFAPPSRISKPRRLSGSAWLLARGGPAGTVSGGQLGASQGGLRLVYALGARRTFSVVARLATPLEGAGREAALGLEWQPTRLPIRLVAEHRFALDGGRGGPTLGVIAGYGPADIAPGLRLEGYGQAGAIVRDGVEGFVDASARVTHPLGRVAGARIDIGVGAWGSAQRAAERFDLGPSIVATVPVARKTLRLTLDWRERVAGAARPGSGPALLIGSDF